MARKIVVTKPVVYFTDEPSQRAWKNNTSLLDHDPGYFVRDDIYPNGGFRDVTLIDLKLFRHVSHSDDEIRPFLYDNSEPDEADLGILTDRNHRHIGIGDKTKRVAAFFPGRQSIGIQLFFARRFRSEAFVPNDFSEISRTIVRSFEAQCELLKRLNGSYFDVLMKDIVIELHGELSPLILNNDAKYSLQENQNLDSVIIALMQDRHIVGLQRIIELLKTFVKPEFLTPELLAPNLAKTLNNSDGNRSWSEMRKHYIAVREQVGDLCDIKIGESLAKEVLQFRERIDGLHDKQGAYKKLKQASNILESLNIEGQEEFYRGVNKRLIEFPDTTMGYAFTRGHLAVVMAIHGTVGQMAFSSPERRDSILQELSPEEIALAFFDKENLPLVVTALADKYSDGSGDYKRSTSANKIGSAAFLYGEGDWIEGKGKKHEGLRARIAFEFTKEIIDRIESECNAYLEKHPNSKIPGMVPPEWEAQGITYGNDRGITKVIAEFGQRLAKNRKVNRELIKYLFKNGTDVDRINMVKYGCLGKKLGNGFLEVYAFTHFGKKIAKALSIVSNELAKQGAKSDAVVSPLELLLEAMERNAEVDALDPQIGKPVDEVKQGVNRPELLPKPDSWDSPKVANNKELARQQPVLTI
ncbi:MAG: hypothetical protein KBF89_01975 [Acidimicrobiia bacterium]|nr:hypothetical protein [Acidimicrobiia bacterium]